MKRFLIVLALTAVAASSAAAAECASKPNKYIKKVERALNLQKTKLSKEKRQEVTSAINQAIKANRLGKKEDACAILEPASEILGIKR